MGGCACVRACMRVSECVCAIHRCLYIMYILIFGCQTLATAKTISVLVRNNIFVMK